MGLAVAVAATTVIEPSPVLSAADAQVTHVVANSWQSSDFHNPANLGCSIGGTSSMPGSRLIMGASQRRPAPMNLVLRKAGWTIPNGTQVQVRAAFSDGSTMDLAGRGNGQIVEIDLDGDQLRTWVHDLTANSNMQVVFAGSEPPWQFDLTGTTKVVNAMSDCFIAHHIEGVGPPFSGAVDAGAGQPTSTTQPFGGTLAGAPNPSLASSAPEPVAAPATTPRKLPLATPSQSGRNTLVQTDQASTNGAKKAETADLTILCPTLQDLIDVYRLVNNDAIDTAISYVHEKKCQNVDKGVPLDLLERGPIVSRVVLTHFAGILSVSTDTYFMRTTDLKD